MNIIKKKFLMYFIFIIILIIAVIQCNTREFTINYQNCYFYLYKSKLYLVHKNTNNGIKPKYVSINNRKNITVLEFYQLHDKKFRLPGTDFEFDYKNIFYICDIGVLDLNINTYYTFKIETNNEPISGYVFLTLENIQERSKGAFHIDYENNIPINDIENDEIVCFTSTDYNQGIKIK